jgi:hypothetical protein
MIAAHHLETVGQIELRAVTKVVSATRFENTFPFCPRQHPFKRNAAQADCNPQIRQKLHLLVKPRRAVTQLFWSRLIAGRGTPHHRADPQVIEPHAIFARRCPGLRREAGLVQNRVEEVSRPVAGKRPSRAVGSMRPRRQAQNHYACVRITERGNGTPPVLPGGICAAPHGGDMGAVFTQAFAALAGTHASIEIVQRGEGRRHSSILGDCAI